MSDEVFCEEGTLIASKKFKGFGKKTLEKLQAQGLNTLEEMLQHSPRGYIDRSKERKLSELKVQESCVVYGEIVQIELNNHARVPLLRACIEHQGESLELIWFHQSFLSKILKKGQCYYFYGMIKKSIRLQMVNPEFYSNKNYEPIEPIYSLGSGISTKVYREALKELVEWMPLEEKLPESYRQSFQLLSIREAFRQLHFPKDTKEVEQAKRRLLYEELYQVTYSLWYKRNLIRDKRYEFSGKKQWVSQIIQQLPYELTNGQKIAIKEIYDELIAGKVMQRLIQGDVGSGKTIVALLMMIFCVENGFQAQLMAPTSVLAQQHFNDLMAVSKTLPIKTALLLGESSKQERELILSKLKSGEIDILIGTHALLEPDVLFNKLGITIIDEQHKFGVEQRSKLVKKASIANLLVMSATPIPRSLALTLYGDLDISIISDMPAGRKPIKTKMLSSVGDLDKVWEFTKKHLVLGRQAYCVCPFIEGGEEKGASIEKMERQLSKEFEGFSLGVLTGKQSLQEKGEIIRRFKLGEIQLLLSTVVIEVGVHVDNAMIMIIMGADRFGLAQLHQLRGRVGRSQLESFCFLHTEQLDGISMNRLKVLEEFSSGFEIAEEDLKLRNGGEVLGEKQSGKSKFTQIHLLRDLRAIHDVREFVEKNQKN